MSTPAPLITPLPDQQPVVPAPGQQDVTPPSAPGQAPPLPKETFRQGFARGGAGRSYVADKEGNIMPAAATTSPSAKGTFGSILAGAALGALQGLTVARPGGVPSHELGGGAGPGAKASEEYFQKRDLLAREKAQQNLQNVRQGKQLNREEAQSAALIAQYNATTARQLQETGFEAEKHPFDVRHAELENNDLALRAQASRATMAEAQLNIVRSLAENGVDPAAVVTSWDQANEHAASLGRGETLALWNGKPGQDQAGVMFNTADLNRPLTRDVQFSSWKQDEKGNLVEQRHTVKAGADSVMSYVSAAMQGQAQLSRILSLQKVEAEKNLQAAQRTNQLAEAGAHQAAAGLTRAQTEQLKSFGSVIPTGAEAPADAFHLSSAQLGQALTLQGVQLPRNFEALYGLAHYKVNPNTFTPKPYNRPGIVPQMDQATAINFVRKFINPPILGVPDSGYDANRFETIKGLEKDFSTGKSAQNLGSFNAAVGHLGQLYEASAALRNGNVQGLNAIANSLSAQFGKKVVPNFDAIKGVLVGEVGRLMKGAAPDIPEMQQLDRTLSAASSPEQFAGVTVEYAHAMFTKGVENVNRYVAWTGELPPYTVSPQAQQVYQRMGIDISSMMGGAPQAQAGPKNPPPVERGWVGNRAIVRDPARQNHWMFEDDKTLVPTGP